MQLDQPSEEYLVATDSGATLLLYYVIMWSVKLVNHVCSMLCAAASFCTLAFCVCDISVTTFRALTLIIYDKFSKYIQNTPYLFFFYYLQEFLEAKVSVRLILSIETVAARCHVIDNNDWKFYTRIRNIYSLGHQYCLQCATLATNLFKNILFQIKKLWGVWYHSTSGKLLHSTNSKKFAAKHV